MSVWRCQNLKVDNILADRLDVVNMISVISLALFFARSFIQSNVNRDALC